MLSDECLSLYDVCGISTLCDGARCWYVLLVMTMDLGRGLLRATKRANVR